MTYYTYIIKSLKNGSYYTGSTKGLAERVERHNQGRSVHTKKGIPWELVYYEEYPDRSSAVKKLLPAGGGAGSAVS